MLRMENFNILGVDWKIWLLSGGSRKTIIERGDYLKREAWTFCCFKVGLGKKEGGGFFEGGLRHQCTLWKYLWKQSEEYCCTCDGTTTFPEEIKNVNTKSYIG